MSEVVAETKPPNRHILLRLLRGLLVFVVLLIATYLIADQVMLRTVQRQREAFKERFGAVDFRDFIPERPAPEEDAGRVYLYAAGLMAKVDEEHGDWSLFHALTQGPEAFKTRRGYEADNGLPTPEELEADVREKMIAMDEAFSFVAQARGMAHGIFLQSYEPVDMLPVLEEIRMVSRNIAAKAVSEARVGNLDAAGAWLESGLHLANTMNNCPTLIVHMVRIACVGVALDAAEEVINTTNIALPLGDRYWTLLDEAASSEVYRNTLAGEAAYGMAQKQKIPMPRLFWSSNESKLIDFYMELDAVSRIESPKERRDRIDAIPVEQKFPMSPMNWMVPMLAPSLVRNINAYERMTAQCDFVRLATSLRAWKLEQGAYPDSLDALATTSGIASRLDPFSGDAYHYRREGDGFMLYSVGPDRKDDGGVTDENRKEGDIVWTCVR